MLQQEWEACWYKIAKLIDAGIFLILMTTCNAMLGPRRWGPFTLPKHCQRRLSHAMQLNASNARYLVRGQGVEGLPVAAKKVWKPIAWCPKKANLADWDVGRLYSSFLLHIIERLLTIDGWTVCRNLTDQIWPILLILLIRSYSYCWSCWSDVAHIAKRGVVVFCQQVSCWIRWFFGGFSYPNNIHPWHLWPLFWNPFNNVPATWKGIFLTMLFQMLPTSI